MAVNLYAEHFEVFKFEETGIGPLIFETAEILSKQFPDGIYPEITYKRDQWNNHIFEIGAPWNYERDRR